ncbi:MAG TPA: response regulator [Candidatus Krumholzibacteria bacterium]|nr:response regulator [Candidatus Krumholzibacteria bacterium]
MIPTRQTLDLQTFVQQGKELLRGLHAVLGSVEPPEQTVLQRLTHATRALRGSASLLGLDAFQSFLGRLFSLLEDLESSDVPWSARLQVLLDESHQCARSYIEALERADPRPRVDELMRVEERLASWRREAARRFEEPIRHADPQHVASQSDLSQRLLDVATLVRQTRELPDVLVAALESSLSQDEVRDLGRELIALGQALATTQLSVTTPAPFEEGLRNHCEGVLRSLVDAAAQEVLDEARERGLRLALRATGSLGEVDDELGGALLEILRHLWLDSMALQAGRGEAQIDSVLRADEDRLIVEVRDAEARSPRGVGDDDVLGRYPGLRHSRPLVESLQGLVWVEPADSPGCRFRLSLPRTASQSAGLVVRIGAHAIALPVAAVESVHDFASARVEQDGAGAMVDVAGMRLPLLHLAFALQDSSYEELAHEFVVVIGSFERRAALLASGPCAAKRGALRPGVIGPWLGLLETGAAPVPVLDVAGLLGRKRLPSRAVEASATTGTRVPTILVVNSSNVERHALVGLLGAGGRRTVAVRSAEEAWDALERLRVDLMICDLRLPEMNAQRLAELRRQSGKHGAIPLVLVLARAGEQSHMVLRQLQAQGFVSSPIHADELTQVVQKFWKHD